MAYIMFLVQSPIEQKNDNHWKMWMWFWTSNKLCMLQVKVVQQSSVESHTAFPERPQKSLTASDVPGKNSAESPREGLRVKRVNPASSSAAGPDPTNENCRVQWDVRVPEGVSQTILPVGTWLELRALCHGRNNWTLMVYVWPWGLCM